MEFRLPAHRAIAAGAVLLLHILLIWMFLDMHGTFRLVREEFQELPITLIPPRPTPKKIKPEEARPERPIPTPQFQNPKAPIINIPPRYNPEEEGLNGLGQYLFNCSAGQYDRLTEREWQQCLGGQWANQPVDRGLRLGQQAPSEWQRDLDERRAKARDIHRPCPKDQPNSNLGLPCLDLSGSHLIQR